MRVLNFLKERVVRGDEYSRVECAPRKGCGANEKYITTGEAALKCRHCGGGQPMRERERERRRPGRRRKEGGGWLTRKELNAIICVGGRPWSQTVNPLPFNYA